MEYQIKNPRWANLEESIIDITLVTSNEELPFSLKLNDITNKGVINDIINGKYGEIAKYTEEQQVYYSIPNLRFEDLVNNKRLLLTQKLFDSIAELYGTSRENLNNIQLKSLRECIVASTILNNLEDKIGIKFKDIIIDNTTATREYLQKILDAQIQISNEIDTITEQYNSNIIKIGQAKDIRELDAIIT